MLLPTATDPKQVLPPGVVFAANSAVMVSRLAREGITATPSPRTDALAPQDLSRLATAITVLVSCRV